MIIAQEKQVLSSTGAFETEHPSYTKKKVQWTKVRDCMLGEEEIKSKTTAYLPRPNGMTGEYATAYDAYIERAHFPLIVSYALQGALGVVITKLPEFNVPKELEYLIENATKDGRSIQQLFLDIIIESFQTGRVPVMVDTVPESNQFKFVQYKAEDLINWKTKDLKSEKSLILAVLTESMASEEDIFSHDTETVYRILYVDPNGKYITKVFYNNSEYPDLAAIPSFMGKTLDSIPLFIAGSINNSYDVQPIPLIPVANCSVQIYRKEADLANSEFLSCNPTLVIVGANNDENLPNVVGSSVMIVIPNEQARVFYTTTDTAALTHVKAHIDSLYEEAIRHGVAILDSRNGVESAEALRIRQATQSASIYSIYLSALNVIKQGLVAMCRWGGYNEEEIKLDAPSALTQGIPDSAVIKQIIDGLGQGVVPLPVIYKYLIGSNLLDQTISYEDYLDMLKESDIPVLTQDNKGEDSTVIKPEVTGSAKTEEELDAGVDQL